MSAIGTPQEFILNLLYKVIEMSDMKLCYNCSDDVSTIYNMQTIIIPMLNDEVIEYKHCLRSLYKGQQKPEYDHIRVGFKNAMVMRIQAIQAFYKRFPDLPRIWNGKRQKSI